MSERQPIWTLYRRAAFITGEMPVCTGLTKVGLPGADLGIRPEDPLLATLLKPLGYATGQYRAAG